MKGNQIVMTQIGERLLRFISVSLNLKVLNIISRRKKPHDIRTPEVATVLPTPD